MLVMSEEDGSGQGVSDGESIANRYGGTVG